MLVKFGVIPENRSHPEVSVCTKTCQFGAFRTRQVPSDNLFSFKCDVMQNSVNLHYNFKITQHWCDFYVCLCLHQIYSFKIGFIYIYISIFFRCLFNINPQRGSKVQKKKTKSVVPAQIFKLVEELKNFNSLFQL